MVSQVPGVLDQLPRVDRDCDWQSDRDVGRVKFVLSCGLDGDVPWRLELRLHSMVVDETMEGENTFQRPRFAFGVLKGYQETKDRLPL